MQALLTELVVCGRIQIKECNSFKSQYRDGMEKSVSVILADTAIVIVVVLIVVVSATFPSTAVPLCCCRESSFLLAADVVVIALAVVGN